MEPVKLKTARRAPTFSGRTRRHRSSVDAIARATSDARDMSTSRCLRSQGIARYTSAPWPEWSRGQATSASPRLLGAELRPMAYELSRHHRRSRLARPRCRLRSRLPCPKRGGASRRVVHANGYALAARRGRAGHLRATRATSARLRASGRTSAAACARRIRAASPTRRPGCPRGVEASTSVASCTRWTESPTPSLSTSTTAGSSR